MCNLWRFFLKDSLWLKLLIMFLYTLLAYAGGYIHGSDTVQLEWNQEKLEHQQHVEKLREAYAGQLLVYVDTQKKLAEQVKASEVRYEKDMSALRAAYADKLRQSEQRIDYYRRQVSNGQAGCNRLADLLPRFDASLTEGIQVVGELARTAEHRDQTINQLRNQLDNVNRLHQSAR